VRGFCVGFGVAMWETMLQEMVPVQLLSRVVSRDFFGSFFAATMTRPWLRAVE